MRVSAPGASVVNRGTLVAAGGVIDLQAAMVNQSGVVRADGIAQGPGGQTRTVRVKEVKEQTVVLDMNHPLAGKTLVFDVKVLSVEPPAK